VRKKVEQINDKIHRHKDNFHRRRSQILWKIVKSCHSTSRLMHRHQKAWSSRTETLHKALEWNGEHGLSISAKISSIRSLPNIWHQPTIGLLRDRRITNLAHRISNSKGKLKFRKIPCSSGFHLAPTIYPIYGFLHVSCIYTSSDWKIYSLGTGHHAVIWHWYSRKRFELILIVAMHNALLIRSTISNWTSPSAV